MTTAGETVWVVWRDGREAFLSPSAFEAEPRTALQDAQVSVLPLAWVEDRRGTERPPAPT
jgi:hypothetical protein